MSELTLSEREREGRGRVTRLKSRVNGGGRLRALAVALTVACLHMQARAEDLSPHFYRYDLAIRVNDELVEFHIPWSCRSKVTWPHIDDGPPLFRRELVPSIQTDRYVRQLKDGAVGFFPFHISCSNGEGYPDVPFNFSIIDNVVNPHIQQRFSKRGQIGLGYKVTVLKSAVVELSAPEHDYVTTPAERALLDAIRDNCSGYQTVIARVIPEETWTTSEALKQQFASLTEVTVAPGDDFPHEDELYKGSSPLIRTFFLIPLTKEGDLWRLPSLNPDDFGEVWHLKDPGQSDRLAEVYFPIVGPKLSSQKLAAEDLRRAAPPATVDLDGTVIHLTNFRQDVYYPKKRWLITLLNQKDNCWSYRYLAE